MKRLTRRQDFLAAAKAVTWGTPGFVIQARDRKDEGEPRIGFTCTKKLGNAVARNRIKRRLREIVRLSFGPVAQASYDYVLVGRSAAATRDFKKLQADLISASSKIHLQQTEQK